MRTEAQLLTVASNLTYMYRLYNGDSTYLKLAASLFHKVLHRHAVSNLFQYQAVVGVDVKNALNDSHIIQHDCLCNTHHTLCVMYTICRTLII